MENGGDDALVKPVQPRGRGPMPDRRDVESSQKLLDPKIAPNPAEFADRNRKAARSPVTLPRPGFASGLARASVRCSQCDAGLAQAGQWLCYRRPRAGTLR
jgi:hypothetical protein